MDITVNEFGNIQLGEVFNPIVFRTDTGEQLIVTMRDGGYEVSYENQKMEMKQGVVSALIGATEHKEAAKGQLDKMTEAATGKKPNIPIQEEGGLEGAHSFRHQILDMSKVNVPNFEKRMSSTGMEHHLDMAFNKPRAEMIVIGNDIRGEENRIIFGFNKEEILKIGPHNIWVWGEVTKSTEDVYEGMKSFLKCERSTWPVNLEHALEVLAKEGRVGVTASYLAELEETAAKYEDLCR